MKRALVVSTKDCAPLTEILRAGGFEVSTASDCASARRQLETSPAARVVVAELNLPDGNWCTLLRVLLDRRLDSKLFVCTRFPGGLRVIEVVQRGGEYSLVRSYAPENLPELAVAA